ARRALGTLVACGGRLGCGAVFDGRADRAAALAGELAAGRLGTGPGGSPTGERTGRGIDARAVGSPAEAVDGADLVLVATTATSPWFDDQIGRASCRERV